MTEAEYVKTLQAAAEVFSPGFSKLVANSKSVRRSIFRKRSNAYGN